MVPLHWLRVRLRESALLENTLSLLIPFFAYAAAEQLHASGVLAVVVVGLYLGHRSWQVDFETRLQEDAVWKMVSFVLESAVFALIGLQLPVVVRGLGEFGAAQALWYAAVVFVVVVLSRFVWVFPATYLPRRCRPGSVQPRAGHELDGTGHRRLGRDARGGVAGHRVLPPAPRCTATAPSRPATSCSS